MRIASLLIVGVLGCDVGPPRPERSTPVPATVELGDPSGQGITWATLEGFVTSGAPAIPETLGGLHLGQSEPDVRATLSRLHDQRLARPQVVELDGYRMYGALVEGFEGVAVTAIVDIERAALHEIDLGLPADQALYAFTQAWGPPDMRADPQLGPVASWTNPATGLVVELVQVGQEQGVAKFRAPPVPVGPPPAAAP